MLEQERAQREVCQSGETRTRSVQRQIFFAILSVDNTLHGTGAVHWNAHQSQVQLAVKLNIRFLLHFPSTVRVKPGEAPVLVTYFLCFHGESDMSKRITKGVRSKEMLRHYHGGCNLQCCV